MYLLKVRNHFKYNSFRIALGRVQEIIRTYAVLSKLHYPEWHCYNSSP
ncbi:hypothetical protein NTGBS_500110 [Candidatus Nitrotoga sp. BS]|nr:hypothetical protein NTGBS_500110 [Candidatus Nitrotoga sp. BS]